MSAITSDTSPRSRSDGALVTGVTGSAGDDTRATRAGAADVAGGGVAGVAGVTGAGTAGRSAVGCGWAGTWVAVSRGGVLTIRSWLARIEGVRDGWNTISASV